MFVTLSTYQAKPGEEDAVIALHEDWQRHQQSQARGYLSGELLRNVEAVDKFIAIMRFESQEAARWQACFRTQIKPVVQAKWTRQQQARLNRRGRPKQPVVTGYLRR